MKSNHQLFLVGPDKPFVEHSGLFNQGIIL